MFRKIDDFTAFWTEHRKETSKVMAILTDASLAQKVADGHRTLGRMAWHIVMTLGEMAKETGLKVDGPQADAPVPDTAAAIGEAYDQAAASLGDQVKSEWTDDTLLVEDNLYGEVWPRGKTLFALALHEVHHRGQMTVLMRQAGLKVPGIYGPSQEEWPNYGMPEPAI
jgi:uncharacterized damage-inducible protein DinB